MRKFDLSLTESLVDGERSQSKSFSSCARIGRIFSFSASSPLRFNSTYPCRSEERFSRNAETDLVCRLLLEKKNQPSSSPRRVRDPSESQRRNPRATVPPRPARTCHLDYPRAIRLFF